MGFGLTVAVSKGPVANARGRFARRVHVGRRRLDDRSGSTRAEELVVVFMTQLLPSGTFNFRGQLKALVYSSIID